ncbi:hypothetical protein [Edaphobacter modestus]|uniref:Peptidase M48-like protein n=1 Tax=Edaphobacter modestus TaxID=388466 RepID=A0A4Q7XZU1_9BACT|nr:hypothetical protein [Edaphobacter modestus]RZU29093.1 hypothetical protein BDD14_6690 [Edaphobacter modestus]
MKHHTRFFIFHALVPLMLTISYTEAHAQNTIKFYSTFAENNVPPADCTQERAVVAPIIDGYQHPTKWTWIIACDEPAWNRVLNHIGQVGVKGEILATTDLQTQVTYVRGFAVIHPFTKTHENLTEHVIAHELAHIMLKSHDEERVEKAASAMMRETRTSVASSF